MGKYFADKRNKKILRSFCLNDESVIALDTIKKNNKKRSKSEIVEAALIFFYNSMKDDGQIKEAN